MNHYLKKSGKICKKSGVSQSGVIQLFEHLIAITHLKNFQSMSISISKQTTAITTKKYIK